MSIQVNNFLQEEITKRNNIQMLISNQDYINWLISFTIKHPNFTSDDWLYSPDELSKEDKEQVEKLGLLYMAIEDYTNKNYISKGSSENSSFYKIQFNNVGFKIGLSINQGTLFFCLRTTPKNDFINFDDIINQTESETAKKIKNMLDELSVFVTYMYENGVSNEIILSQVEITLRELKVQNNKSLIKIKNDY